MKREKGRTWDGVSRIPDDTYRKNWEEIFGKTKQPKKENNNEKKSRS